ncbi:GNAT family N-acetyltransferase [Streptomyces olivaceus]
MIGFGRIALDPHQPNGATFGFALRPDAWGVAYGAETVRLLLGLEIEEIGLHRIWDGRSPLDEASARTMAAVGMIEEGTIRGHVRKAGQWRDSIVHSMLEEEWKGGWGSGGGSRPGRGEQRYRLPEGGQGHRFDGADSSRRSLRPGVT